MYGLHDTKDNCWMGDNRGPFLYKKEELAQIAARIVDVQLKQVAGRTKSTLYTEDVLVKKDDKEVLIGAEEAIEKLECGAVI